ncbi:osmotically inducible protein C [Thermosipho affectus]|uniref:Osmotically inducible protein C n=1 Tax=Thermosipho affectus TaxID=660294 RepID=A0ABX3IIH4_9BACT|nr:MULTISPECIES: OsmC family protein [Thermosipho]ANQ53757.1 osmotically inducible protein C [Thermosipho sp. 1070]APT72203.1 osmotically inducible protein C [Thermosipho sp. 1063]ONN27109.1 osmotically inducible protein C [Thermosipho affectus]OOC43446.1 osmotically inducible protein C [Thermosipho sp. 1074]
MAFVKFGVSAESENFTKTLVTARNFKMTIDEPENLGGKDEGPNPVEYLLAAFAGCLNVVGHLVAKEMGFELKKIKIDIEGDLNPNKFLGKPSEDRTGFTQINVSLSLETNASEETLNEWLKKVEQRCPVSDNLANPTPIKFSLSKF